MNDFNRSKLETAIKECVLHAEVARDEHWQADFAGRGSIPNGSGIGLIIVGRPSVADVRWRPGRDGHWQADFAGRGSIPDWHRIDFRRSALRGRRPMAG